MRTLVAIAAVVLLSGAGCLEDASEGPPVIDSQPVDVTALDGEAVSFSVGVSGAGPMSYQWTRDGVDIAGANSATYTIAAATLADDGAVFTCVATNPEGSAESDAVTLTVNVAPPTITQDIADTLVAAGLQTHLAVQATGTTPSYQWRRSDDGGGTWADIGGATSDSCTTPVMDLADDGAMFVCVVSNAADSVESTRITVTVRPPAPSLDFDGDGYADVIMGCTDWDYGSSGGTAFLFRGGAALPDTFVVDTGSYVEFQGRTFADA